MTSFTKYEDNIKTTVKMLYNNAFIQLVLDDETWTKKLYYNLKKSFKSNVRLCAYYSQKNKHKKKAPKGQIEDMFHYLLIKLISKYNYNKESIIVIEADGSDNNELIKKVYEPMGFTFLSADKSAEKDWPNGAGGLMISTIETILNKKNKKNER